jgi:hypothetical protein
LIGGAVHRSASSAFHPMFGSPGASCGYTSSSVEQVEHSIVAILEVTGIIAILQADQIMPVLGCPGSRVG